MYEDSTDIFKGRNWIVVLHFLPCLLLVLSTTNPFPRLPAKRCLLSWILSRYRSAQFLRSRQKHQLSLFMSRCTSAVCTANSTKNDVEQESMTFTDMQGLIGCGGRKWAWSRARTPHPFHLDLLERQFKVSNKKFFSLKASPMHYNFGCFKETVQSV